MTNRGKIEMSPSGHLNIGIIGSIVLIEFLSIFFSKATINDGPGYPILGQIGYHSVLLQLEYFVLFYRSDFYNFFCQKLR